MKFLKTLATLAFLTALLPGIVSAQLINTVVSITGNIFDAVSREPVSCHLLITDEAGKRITMAKSNAFDDGYYFMTGLMPGQKYFVTVLKKNFFKEKFKISVPNTGKYQEISRDFLIKPKTKGALIPFPVPPFELNKSKLRYGADELIGDFISTLSNNPKTNVEIICYPDNDKSAAKNKSMTEERCASLKEYFEKNGIASSRLSFVANSKTDPKDPPPTKTRAKGKRYIGPIYMLVK